MMTRKDYVLIAAALKGTLPVADTADRLHQHGEIAYRLAQALEQTNPRFDRARFLKACGVQS